MIYSCNDCPSLDKGKKKLSSCNYLYGCKFRSNGYVVGWVQGDSQLKTMGCSDFGKKKIANEQISMF
jgi:hypothetical protein